MNAKAKRLAVIGLPIAHSLSPIIHQHWLDENHILQGYEKLEVKPAALETFLDSLIENNFLGINITLPHKQQCYAMAQRKGWHISQAAHLAGSVNMLSVKGQRLYADSSDGAGFMRALKNKDAWQKQKPVMIIGAGGAALAIAAALVAEGISKIFILNRTEKNAQALANKINGDIEIKNFDNYQNALSQIGLLVQATSLGLAGTDELPFSFEALHPRALVMDIVYRPLKTEFLKNAEAHGNQIIDGLGMLLYQAQIAFELWFDIKVQVNQAVRKKVERFL